MDHTPDITDDPRIAGIDACDSASACRARKVEDHTDSMIELCKSLDYCIKLNADYELGYGDLLPKLMQAVASWTGSSSDSHRTVLALHNILAAALQDIAEYEVGA